jgi:hypothetical protein
VGEGMAKRFLFCLLLFFRVSESEESTVSDRSDNLEALPNKYLPQIFEPFNAVFLTEIMKSSQRIEEGLRVDEDLIMEVDDRQLVDQFHSIRNILNESVNSLMKQCQQFSQQTHLISESEANNGSILIQELNEDVVNEANVLLDSVALFHERMTTLFQLSDDKFLKLRGKKLRESVSLYLMAFEDEAKEFNGHLQTAITALNKLKDESSVQFLYDRENDEVLTTSGSKRLKPDGAEVILEGLEDLFVQTNNQEL